MASSDTPVLATRLKLARKKTGFTQAQIAKLLNIEIGTLSGYERGYRRPSTDMLAEIANLYDVSADYLLGQTDNPQGIQEKKQTPADTAGTNIGSIVEERPAAHGTIELTDILIIENKDKITYMGMPFSEDDIIITRDLIEAAFKPRLPRVIPIYPPPPPRDYSKIPKIEDIDPDQVPLPEEFMFKDQRINRYEYLQAEGRLPTDEDWKNLVENYKHHPPK